MRAFGARGDGRTDDSRRVPGARSTARSRRGPCPPGATLRRASSSLRSHTRLCAGEAPRRSSPGASAEAPRCCSPRPAREPRLARSARQRPRHRDRGPRRSWGAASREGPRQCTTSTSLVSRACTRPHASSRCAFRALPGRRDLRGIGSSSRATSSGTTRTSRSAAAASTASTTAEPPVRSSVHRRHAACTIEGNHFRNCSRFDMPGAVDIEPDEQRYPRCVARRPHRAQPLRERARARCGAVCVILADLDALRRQPPRGDPHRRQPRSRGDSRTPGIVAQGVRRRAQRRRRSTS